MLGIVTLKHHDNTTKDTVPLYPKPEEYFSITGILTKKVDLEILAKDFMRLVF